MAYATTLETVNKELAQGNAEWIKNGVNLLTHLVEFAEQHTHTGTVDGLAIPAGAYTAGSIDADDLATSVKTHSVDYVYGAEADTFEYSVFRAPVGCVVSAPYITAAANIVGATNNYSVLSLVHYRGASCVATLVSKSCTSGTLVALTPTSWGTLTGGTLAAGDHVTVKKATVGSGLALGAGCAFNFTWIPS